MSEMKGSSTAPPLFVVALAASAGGLATLSSILSALPAHFPAAVVVVQHLSPEHASYLTEILSRRTVLKVKQVEDKDVLRPGVIYVAPPDWHVLVKPGGVLGLAQSEPLHHVWPSADLLFESLAESCKEYAITVILTGTGIDGSNTLKTVKALKGTVIAQDEATSEFLGMPGAAIQTGFVDYVLSLQDMASLLLHLVTIEKAE